MGFVEYLVSLVGDLIVELAPQRRVLGWWWLIAVATVLATAAWLHWRAG